MSSRDLAERWLGDDGDLSSDEISVLARSYLGLIEQLEALRRALKQVQRDLELHEREDGNYVPVALTVIRGALGSNPASEPKEDQ